MEKIFSPDNNKNRSKYNILKYQFVPLKFKTLMNNILLYCFFNYADFFLTIGNNVMNIAKNSNKIYIAKRCAFVHWLISYIVYLTWILNYAWKK